MPDYPYHPFDNMVRTRRLADKDRLTITRGLVDLLVIMMAIPDPLAAKLARRALLSAQKLLPPTPEELAFEKDEARLRGKQKRRTPSIRTRAARRAKKLPSLATVLQRKELARARAARKSAAKSK